jgi:hypothetical protein
LESSSIGSITPCGKFGAEPTSYKNIFKSNLIIYSFWISYHASIFCNCLTHFFKINFKSFWINWNTFQFDFKIRACLK